MEAEKAYTKCRDHILEIKVLFSYYAKYNSCISSQHFNKQVNEILCSLSKSCSTVMFSVGEVIKDHAVLLSDSKQYLELICADTVFTIDEILLMFDKYKHPIIDMIHKLSDQRRHGLLYNFETSNKDAHQLINRMKMMIINSQNIFQPYHKISA